MGSAAAAPGKPVAGRGAEADLPGEAESIRCAGAGA